MPDRQSPKRPNKRQDERLGIRKPQFVETERGEDAVIIAALRNLYADFIASRMSDAKE